MTDQMGTGDTVCDNCGRANPVWYTPNEIWNASVGGPDCAGDPGGILCPVCFIRQAERAGIKPHAWSVAPGRPRILAQEAARVLLNSDDFLLELEMSVHGDDHMMVSEALRALAGED